MRLHSAAPSIRNIAEHSVLKRVAARPSSLLTACTLAALIAAASPALADETWATDLINRMAAERDEESGRTRSRRATPVERVAEWDRDEDDEMRPQRRSARGRAVMRQQRRVRLASLGHEVAPVPMPSATIAKETPSKPAANSATTIPGRVLASLGRDLAAPLASPQQRPDAPRRKLGPMVASLGREFVAPLASEQPSLSGGHINWVASASCLAAPLRAVVAQIAANFGSLRVNSTCRSHRHNARVGGAKRSYHLTGSAVDFRVASNVRQIYAFLRGTRSVGGLKHYGGGLFHIDTGPRRSW